MSPKSLFSLKPEYVDEMTVDAETELKHKVWCVRKLLGPRYSKNQLERYCTLYGITAKQVLKYEKSLF